MAKTTRRPRTTHATTPAHDLRTHALHTAVTDREIARRAYEIYEQRGGQHGRDWDDWLLAEKELRDALDRPLHSD